MLFLLGDRAELPAEEVLECLYGSLFSLALKSHT